MILEPSPDTGKHYLCAGCGKPTGSPGSVITVGGRAAPLCALCTQRAHDSDVFRDTVVRCVAGGSTVTETEGVFAKLGLQMPTTEAGVHSVLTEMARRFAQDTGLRAPPADVLLGVLLRAAR